MAHQSGNICQEPQEAVTNIQYVSCIRICGQPILPPLMTPERREEMRLYKAMAEKVQERIKRKSLISIDDAQTIPEAKSDCSPKRVDTHDILDEFDPLSHANFSGDNNDKKCRHSGSSDELSTLKTDSSNTSVALTNSTDLYHYMDTTGSSFSDWSTKRTCATLSTPGTLTANQWDRSPPKVNSSSDSSTANQPPRTTYEGINKYLDSILRSGAPTPSNQALEEKLSFKDATPSNPDSHLSLINRRLQENTPKNDDFSLEELAPSHPQKTRSFSCPLSPIPPDSIFDSAAGTLSENQFLATDLSTSSSVVKESEKGGFSDGGLIDLRSDKAASSDRLNLLTTLANSENTLPRLVRSNSYTLESPSPMLLAHLEAEKLKSETTKTPTVKPNLKQTSKDAVLSSKIKGFGIDRQRSFLNKRNEHKLYGAQARKVATKPRVSHSPPKKSSPPACSIVHSSSLTNISSNSNRSQNKTSPNLSKISFSAATNSSKETTSKPAQKESVSDPNPVQRVRQDIDHIATERVRKLFTDLQAAHNRQMEELLLKQRREQELIRHAIISQKDFLTNFNSAISDITGPSDPKSIETNTWAELLKTNSSNDPSFKENRAVDDKEGAGQGSVVNSVSNGIHDLQILEKNFDEPKEIQDEATDFSRNQRTVLKPILRESNHTVEQSPPSLLFPLPQVFTEKHIMTASAPSGVFELSPPAKTLHRVSSLPKIDTELQPGYSKFVNLDVNKGDDASARRPSSSPALRNPNPPTESITRSFTSSDDKDRCDILGRQTENSLRPVSAATCSDLEEVPLNLCKDSNGNFPLLDDPASRAVSRGLDNSENCTIPSSVFQQLNHQITVEGGGTLFCLDLITSESYPTVPNFSNAETGVVRSTAADKESSPIILDHLLDDDVIVPVSPRSRRRVWSNRQVHPQNGSLVLGDPDWLEFSRQRQKLWAATKIQAAVRGYLTRRLLRTERVQGYITVIHDTILCALQLQKECARSVEQSDLELHARLIHQLSDACKEIHNIFIELPVAKRMAIIAVDRERLLTPRSPRTNAPRPLSRATQIALNRKMMQNSVDNSNQITSPRSTVRRKNWANLDKNRAKSSDSCTAENCEKMTTSLTRPVPASSNETQRSMSASCCRKPWR